MSFDSTVHDKAISLVKLSYEMTAAAGSGHPTTAASLAHLVTVLMYGHMRYEPSNPTHPCSDRLVLSEGHGVPIVYAACADVGVVFGADADHRRPMTRDDVMTLRAINSPLDGHPNPAVGFPFFDAATGSLGQGLSVSAGLACAAKIDGVDRRIFCLIGDGESREGQIWEALDFIRDHGLSGVCTIFNCNAYGQSDAVSAQQSPDVLGKKLEAVGFRAIAIDGHQPTQIQEAFSAHAQSMYDPEAPPVAVVARTMKGWGSSSVQGHGYHGKPITGQELQQVLAELDQTAHQIGAASDTPLKIGLMSTDKPASHPDNPAPGFPDALRQLGMGEALSQGRMATRRAYGVALWALGHACPRVVALDADVKNSTFADMFSRDEALSARFLECRIAEQNMFTVAVGLSAGHKLPFASTFAKFVTRGYDQIEMAVNSGANLKIVGSHAGITLAADGPSQMGLPDVSWFRSFTTVKREDGQPCFYVLQPSDAYQAYALTLAMADYNGPCYMRTLRPDVEFLYGENDAFRLGGHEVLSEGRDLLIVACGYMVHEANKALEKLDAEGIDATLVDLYSMPFDADAILDLANENNGMIITLEDNYGGGIGSAIADAVSADGGGFNLCQMFARRIPKSGRTIDDVLGYCGLRQDHIVAQAMQMLQLTASKP